MSCNYHPNNRKEFLEKLYEALSYELDDEDKEALKEINMCSWGEDVKQAIAQEKWEV